MNTDYKLGKITEKIIGAFYKVDNILGSGFLENIVKYKPQDFTRFTQKKN